VLAVLAGTGCGGSSGSGSATTAGAAATTAAASQSGIPQASSGAARTVTVTAGDVKASMRGATHTPTAGKPWPFQFTVTSGGTPAHASVSYQYLLAGQIVARRSHYTFTGQFNDVTFWPSSAVGYTLTLRAVVVTGPTTMYLDYPVRVQR
jgi:hypothetical protein